MTNIEKQVDQSLRVVSGTQKEVSTAAAKDEGGERTKGQNENASHRGHFQPHQPHQPHSNQHHPTARPSLQPKAKKHIIEINEDNDEYTITADETPSSSDITTGTGTNCAPSKTNKEGRPNNITRPDQKRDQDPQGNSEDEEGGEVGSEGRGIASPRDNDILSGRGAGVNLHPGNVFFRELIRAHKQSYIKADPGQKKRIIRGIVEVAEKHGRFLKQDPVSELWVQINSNEARKKTGQALRENAPAIKKQQENLKRKRELEHAHTISVMSSLLPTAAPSHTPLNLSAAADLLSSSSQMMMDNNRLYLPSNATANRNNANTTNSSGRAYDQEQNHFLPSSPSHAGIIWARMNLLQEKQEQLKRKQRELEDEHNQLMQYILQSMTANVTASTLSVDPLRRHNQYRHRHNYSTGVMFDSPSSSDDSVGHDSDSDIYARVAKKSRIIV